MISRYLGKKTALLDPIMAAVDKHCTPGARVCDIFSGTLAVALELKRRGYSVIANDICLFSAIIGEAFLINNEIPEPDLEGLLPRLSLVAQQAAAVDWIDELSGTPDFDFLGSIQHRRQYASLLTLLTYLGGVEPCEVPTGWLRSDFYDTYTEAGRNSAFTSLRGRSGRRRFFSPKNGQRIDIVLSLIRYWWCTGAISRPLYSVLLSCLLRAVEKVSNTQGTYHDFPRRTYDPRSHNPLSFEAPSFDVALTGGSHIIGREEDSLEFIRSAPEHELLYIDPPYNFRQYTSYYFMLNLISRYCDIDDLDDYFANVEYVRGQNMASDFSSTFNRSAQFLGSLRALIEGARTRVVVLSYFDGRNHWNSFKSAANGVGYRKITEFFNSTLFVPNTLEVIPIPRTNYQSYGGYKARTVSEYLFVAEKARREALEHMA